jgi:hypothetical protein
MRTKNLAVFESSYSGMVRIVGEPHLGVIAVGCLMSHKLGLITKEIVEQVLQKGDGDRRIMGIDLSVNIVMNDISTHVDVTFFSQNKPTNYCLRFGRCFETGKTVCIKTCYRHND